MYYEDHAPPHFHAYYAEHSAVVAIETLQVLEGSLPRRAMSMVLEWALEHRPELADSWTLAERHQPLNPIAPLELLMHRVIEARARDGYRLEVTFEDGLSGEIDLSDRLFGPLFEPLRDSDLFAQVGIDEFGVPCWPNGADVAPDALRRHVEAATQAHQAP